MVLVTVMGNHGGARFGLACSDPSLGFQMLNWAFEWNKWFVGVLICEWSYTCDENAVERSCGLGPGLQ